ncbi:hypothetical protein HYS49_00460 [Candidatus Woesearchaeota archaeon]|nr:hypothetical protein [Candidatus Woesearchaeota archaeon]
MWELKETNEFEQRFEKLPPDIKQRFERQIKKLEENPYGLGKPLGCPWFRELKNNKFRVYYLVYDPFVVVLFVGVSDKKEQQASIDSIKNNFAFFKEFVEKEAKILKEKPVIEYGMDKGLQKLLQERQELVNRVCWELWAIEERRIKILQKAK